jgi:hypothetical protein
VPLCLETFGDIDRIFSPPVFGGACTSSASHGNLFHRALEPHIGRPPKCRARRLNCIVFIVIPPSSVQIGHARAQRADPFELLAPDEQEEDELDLHAALIDPEERRGYLSAKSECANDAVPCYRPRAAVISIAPAVLHKR